MTGESIYMKILSVLKDHYDNDSSAYVGINMIKREFDASDEELRTYMENLEMNRYIEKLEGEPIAESYLLRIRHKGIDALKNQDIQIVKECRLHGPQKLRILKILREEGYYVSEKTILDKLNISKDDARLYADELEYCGLAKRVEAMYPNFTLKITDEGMAYLAANEEKGMHRSKFEIFKFENQFFFRLKAPNGEEIALSQPYNSRSNCEKGIESVKRNASIAEVIDLTNN